MADSVQVAVGKRLKACRQQKKLSQVQLTKLSGVSAKFVSSIEHGEGNPSLATLDSLAKALGVPVGLIVGDDVGTEIVQMINARSKNDRARLLRIVKAYCEK